MSGRNRPADRLDGRRDRPVRRTDARRAVYDVIALRRDVRHFRADAPVDEATLARILGAAHPAPSVGFSQPWGFVVVRDRARRARDPRELPARAATPRRRAFRRQRREQYLALPARGDPRGARSTSASPSICAPRDEAILGTTAQPEAVRASACCAVQNLWLAARAEGIGVGWVSIVEPAVLRARARAPAGRRADRVPLRRARARVPREPDARGDGLARRAGRSPTSCIPIAVARRARRAPTRAPTRGRAPVTAARDARAARSTRPRARRRCAHQATLTKPVGSLGRLEEIAAWYAGARGAFPAPRRARAALARLRGRSRRRRRRRERVRLAGHGGDGART